MRTSERAAAGGIYIHVPFCVRKCDYCDFYSITDLSRIPAYLEALFKEIRLSAETTTVFDSLYLGGGTPSILTPRSVTEICDVVRSYYTLASDTEITIEINPGTVDINTLSAFREAGVNRLSIGVQSFQADHLHFLGRIHTVGQARAAIVDARAAGFNNISIDLMYGLPGQTRDLWRDDLLHGIGYQPAHFSCYMLSYEPGTPLQNRRDRLNFNPLPDDRVGDLFEYTVHFLAENGYALYEVSNFARDTGLQSRHNCKYWEMKPYQGLGPGAHSYKNGCRSWNFRHLNRYIDRLRKEQLPVEATENVSPEQQRIEFVYLGLRQSTGIEMPDYEKRFGQAFTEAHKAVLPYLLRDQYLILSGERCRATIKGLRFLDSVVGMLVACY